MSKARKHHSETIERLLKEISLETNLKVSFMLNDITKWKNGEFLGDVDEVNNNVQIALKVIED